jgi:hypothetical protein
MGTVAPILPEYTKMVSDAFSWIDTAENTDQLKIAGADIDRIKGKLELKDKNDLRRAYEAKARTLSPKAAA